MGHSDYCRAPSEKVPPNHINAAEEMVKHGTQKKRRRGVKVTRKQPKHRAVRIANSVVHSRVKEIYDKDKPPQANMIAMGLVSDVNSSSGITGGGDSVQHAAFVGYGNRVTGELYEESNPKRKVISEFDAEYAHRNIEKHGDDYKAMQRDIKTNDRQYTARQMQKLCEKYKRASSSDS